MKEREGVRERERDQCKWNRRQSAIFVSIKSAELFLSGLQAHLVEFLVPSLYSHSR